MRFVAVTVILVMAVAFVGLVAWPVTGPVNWFLGRVERSVGWNLSVAQARWIPWKDLELTDLIMKAPSGGKVHLVGVRIRPYFSSVLSGGLSTRWTMDGMRVDPGS